VLRLPATLVVEPDSGAFHTGPTGTTDTDPEEPPHE
jgi:hypothetical protein